MAVWRGNISRPWNMSLARRPVRAPSPSKISTTARPKAARSVLPPTRWTRATASSSSPTCSARNRVILYGANLPMLVKLAKLRHLPADQAAAMAAEAGRKYIDSYNVFDEVAPRKVAQ